MSINRRSCVALACWLGLASGAWAETATIQGSQLAPVLADTLRNTKITLNSTGDEVFRGDPRFSFYRPRGSFIETGPPLTRTRHYLTTPENSVGTSFPDRTERLYRVNLNDIGTSRIGVESEPDGFILRFTMEGDGPEAVAKCSQAFNDYNTFCSSTLPGLDGVALATSVVDSPINWDGLQLRLKLKPYAYNGGIAFVVDSVDFVGRLEYDTPVFSAPPGNACFRPSQLCFAVLRYLEKLEGRSATDHTIFLKDLKLAFYDDQFRAPLALALHGSLQDLIEYNTGMRGQITSVSMRNGILSVGFLP